MVFFPGLGGTPPAPAGFSILARSEELHKLFSSPVVIIIPSCTITALFKPSVPSGLIQSISLIIDGFRCSPEADASTEAQFNDLLICAVTSVRLYNLSLSLKPATTGTDWSQYLWRCSRAGQLPVQEPPDVRSVSRRRKTFGWLIYLPPTYG